MIGARPRRLARPGTRPLVGLDAGGHARCVVEALRSSGSRIRIAALLDDDPALHGTAVMGISVLGGTDLLLERHDGALSRVRAGFVGVGGAREAAPRQRLHERLLAAGLAMPVVVHASAEVARSARLRQGAQVLAGAVVNAQAEVGDGAIVNARAVIGHDAVVGRHAHVASGAVLGGAAIVGPGAHVGARAAVLEGRIVGEGAVVGAGAVVLDDVPAGAVVVGIPARPATRRSGAS